MPELSILTVSYVHFQDVLCISFANVSGPRWYPVLPPPYEMPPVGPAAERQGNNFKVSKREREIFIDNLLVRVHLIIEMSGPTLRHGSLNSLFQVALYPPS